MFRGVKNQSVGLESVHPDAPEFQSLLFDICRRSNQFSCFFPFKMEGKSLKDS